MDWDWQALATALRERRKTLGLTQEQLADRAGMHVATIKDYEAGREYTRFPKSWNALEPELGWAAGSALATLKGGRPTIVDSVPDRNYTREPFKATVEIIRDATYGIVAYVAPDTPFSKVREAERQTIELFRQRGLLPPEEDVEQEVAQGGDNP